jgi:hypothetical protein
MHPEWHNKITGHQGACNKSINLLYTTTLSHILPDSWSLLGTE